MKEWKTCKISFFVVFCILLNYTGRMIADHYSLPLWMDSFGTVIASYVMGPLCGCIIGVTGNLIYSMIYHTAYVYALISIALGLTVGWMGKRGVFETLYGTMSVSSLLAAFCTAISVPLNFFFYGGSTGNLWGDGVSGYLGERGIPRMVCVTAGQFYLEFADKFVTLLFLFVLIRIWNLIRKAPSGKSGLRHPFRKTGKLFLLFLLLLFTFVWQVRAEEQQRKDAEGIRILKLNLDKGSANSTLSSDQIDYNDYVQTVFSSKNGLPCGEANDIAQTSDGILWIGTYAGLYRYNGREFRWMDNYESVHNVNCMYVDAEGRLWIGTNDNGLSIAINEKIVNVVGSEDGLPSSSVRCIGQSSEGYYYIGTTGAMMVVELNSGLKQVAVLDEITYADNICSDESGRVAVVSATGELFLLEGTQIKARLADPEEHEIFNCCGFTPDGTLMVGSSSNCVYTYDDSSGDLVRTSRIECGSLSGINSFYFRDEGEIFLCADNGVGYLDSANGYHSVNTNDFNSSIDNMTIDYQGNLWFTSSRLGLLRMAQSSFRDVYSAVGMESKVVNAVTRWGDDFYIGTDKGLDVVDASFRTRITNDLTKLLADIRIRCIRVDLANHLWICTYKLGLMEIEPDGTTYLYDQSGSIFGNRTRVALEGKDGTMIASGDAGLAFIRDHKILRTILYSEASIDSVILTLTEMDDGRILAGTDGDGIAVIENGEVSRILTRSDGLSSNVILRTVKDPYSQGVFVVTSNGMCYMEGDEQIRLLDNFPYFNNYDVCFVDSGKMFVMSSAGIYVVNREELLSGQNPVSYELLDSRQGLHSSLTANSWNYTDSQGRIFLPCDTGVFIIDTEKYSTGIRTFRMLLSTVMLDQTEYKMNRNRTLIISRGTSRIELYPEIINYSIEDPNVGYYLEGFETEWNILPLSAMKSVVYTNLPTGEYRFHLAVFDSSQQKILESMSCSLQKEKEIYDNQWFLFYMIFVAALVVAWLTVFIVKMNMQKMLNVQRRELELARMQVEMGNETVVAIAKAVDAKDENTSQHSFRVSEYAVMIANEMGFSEKEKENLRRAAQMHDIGKIGIPDAILNKPGRLTDDEYFTMKSHVTRGAEILKDFTMIEHVVDGARYHHERYDGRGYPDGLQGENIPLYGRIIGVADAFDAMTANRVYRKQMDFGYVLGEMQKGKGTQFDPEIVDILLRLIDEKKIRLEELYPGFSEAKKEGGE